MIYQLYSQTLADMTTPVKQSEKRQCDHLYVAQASYHGKTILKIGRSKNIANRLIQLRNYVKDATIINVIPLAGLYEHKIHEALKEHRFLEEPLTHGIEWYYDTEPVREMANKNSRKQLTEMWGGVVAKKDVSRFKIGTSTV